MPLLHIVGATSMNRIFDVGFCMMPDELEGTYQWAVNCLKELYNIIKRSPRIFITDNEAALKSCLHRTFEGVPQRACLWHLLNNVECKVLEYWGENRAPWGQEARFKALKEEFLSAFQRIVDARTEEQFTKLYNKLKTEYSI